MNRAFKNFLKRMPLYPLYQKFQQYRHLKETIRRYWEWTEDDENRAGFYRQFISPGDLVFDVGANMGNRAKVFWKLGAQVVAFEPQVGCYDYLRLVFTGKKSVRLVNRALGKTEGETEMFIADASIISSLSTRWIEAVRRSGRFSENNWDKKQRVEITTLDKAIQEFGTPSFIKVDVEGYEFEVLSGLSNPVDCVSIEFTPEDIQNTLNCIDHMSSLSSVDARLSLGESLKWETPSWLNADKIKQELAVADPTMFGDVYIRCLMNKSG
jgi:FkbM family methyltransferase